MAMTVIAKKRARTIRHGDILEDGNGENSPNMRPINLAIREFIMRQTGDHVTLCSFLLIVEKKRKQEI